MKNKLLLIVSAFLFAFFMAFSITSSEQNNKKISFCGEAALADVALNHCPCSFHGADPCSACPTDCVCLWNIAEDPEEGK